jgi:hypothetical protein
MSISLHSAADCEKSPSLLAAWIGKIIFALVAAVVMRGRIYLLDDSKLQAGSDVVLPFVSPLVAALFALAPLLACFAHTISIEQVGQPRPVENQGKSIFHHHRKSQSGFENSAANSARSP